MPRNLDEKATIAMLAALKDGDKPLEKGDEFYHPAHGPMTVSRVLGWTDMLHLDGHQLKGERVLRVMAFRLGKKKAERVDFLLPEKGA